MNDIEAALKKTRATIGSVAAPSSAGVYAIYLQGDAELPSLGRPVDGLIYVGSSGNLASREYDMHFSSRGTGFSTLRRSLGALLKDELTLEAIPRSSGKAQSNYQNYRFRAEGEEKLTSWMVANLEVGVCPVDSEYRPVEKQLIAELQPVLCLTGWPNPHARQIKESRRKCADEARSR